MTRAKTSNIFTIISTGIKIYISHLFSLTNPIVLPVLAILIGLSFMILPIYLLPKYYTAWAEAVPILRELYAVITIFIISIIPGLIVFKLGFWNYMLKFVSLNNIVGDILKRKVLKHHSYYTKIVSLRTKDYLLMLSIWCSIWLMGLALPFSVYLFNIDPAFLNYILIGFEFIAVFLLIILSIYLSLSFQVFAFETSFGPMQTLEESFKLVLNNFWRILVLSITLSIITSILVPQVFVFLADILMIKSTIALPIEAFLNGLYQNYPQSFETLQTLPMFGFDSIEKFIEETAKCFSFTIISTVISLLMLPLGSCLYTLFYFDAKKRHLSRNSNNIEQQEEQKSTGRKNRKTIKVKKNNV